MNGTIKQILKPFSYIKEGIKNPFIKTLLITGITIFALKSLYKWGRNNRIFSIKDLIHHHEHKRGLWAIVIGAASGNGRKLALKFARKGYNLILLDLDLEVLAKTAEEIRNKYPKIHMRVIFADINEAVNDGFFKLLDHYLHELEVSIILRLQHGQEHTINGENLNSTKSQLLNIPFLVTFPSALNLGDFFNASEGSSLYNITKFSRSQPYNFESTNHKIIIEKDESEKNLDAENKAKSLILKARFWMSFITHSPLYRLAWTQEILRKTIPLNKIKIDYI